MPRYRLNEKISLGEERSPEYALEFNLKPGIVDERRMRFVCLPRATAQTSPA